MKSSDSGGGRLALAEATGRLLRADPRLLVVLAAHVLFIFLVAHLGIGLFIDLLEQSLGRTTTVTAQSLLNSLALILGAGVGWIGLRAITTVLVGDALRTDVAPTRDSTLARLLRNSPTLIAFGLLQPVVGLCRLLDTTRVGRRLTTTIFSDATATATAFVLPSTTLDHSALGDALRQSADVLRTNHNGPVAIRFPILPRHTLYALGAIIGGIGLTENSSLLHDVGHSLSHAFHHLARFLVENGSITVAVLAVLLAWVSLYRTIGTVGLFLGYTGRLDNTKLLPATPRGAAQITELADYEFSYSALGGTRTTESSQDTSPLSSGGGRSLDVTIPHLTVPIPSLSSATRQRIRTGLRTVGTPLASALFVVDGYATRAGRYLREAGQSRTAKGAAILGVSTTTVSAIIFASLIILIGPLSATGSVALIGHDAHARIDGDNTVEQNHVLGNLFAAEQLQDEVHQLRLEAAKGQNLTNPEGRFMHDDTLQRAAARHTTAMAAMGEVTHQSPDGVSPDERFARAGITCEKRFTTDDPHDSNNRSGERFQNTTPTEIVGSYHYGLAEQYTLSNEALPVLADEARYGDTLRPWKFENIDPRRTQDASRYSDEQEDAPVYDSNADMGGAAPWTPDVMKLLTYTVRDIVTDEDNQNLLTNRSYTHYGISYHMTEDRTVYYTVVMC